MSESRSKSETASDANVVKSWLSSPFRVIILINQLVQTEDVALSSLIYLLELQQIQYLQKGLINSKIGTGLKSLFLMEGCPLYLSSIPQEQIDFVSSQIDLLDGSLLFEIFYTLRIYVMKIINQRILSVEQKLYVSHKGSLESLDRERGKLSEADHGKLMKLIEPALKFLKNQEASNPRSVVILSRMLSYLKFLRIPPHLFSMYQVQPKHSRSTQRNKPSESKHYKRVSQSIMHQIKTKSEAGTNNKPEGKQIIKRIQQSLKSDKDSWCASVSEQIYKTLNKKEIKRQELIYELIKLEKGFANSMLVLLEVFYNPLKTQPNKILSETNTWIIFSNIDEVLVCSLLLCSKLFEKQDQDGPIINCISDVFNEDFEVFKIFASFCSNQVIATDKINKVRHKDVNVDTYFKQCEANERCQRKNLSEFLVYPMQHLTRYILMLEAISKATPEDHSDYDNLISTVIPRVKETIKHVEERVAVVRDSYKLKKLQKSLDTSDIKGEIDLCNNIRRRFVFEGELTVDIQRDVNAIKKAAEKGRKDAKKNQYDKMHVLLFTDLLLLTQKTNSKKKNLKVSFEPIVLDNNVMAKDSNSESKRSFFFIFRENDNHQLLVLQAYSAAEKDKWISVIMDTVKILQAEQQQQNQDRPLSQNIRGSQSQNIKGSASASVSPKASTSQKVRNQKTKSIGVPGNNNRANESLPDLLIHNPLKTKSEPSTPNPSNNSTPDCTLTAENSHPVGYTSILNELKKNQSEGTMAEGVSKSANSSPKPSPKTSLKGNNRRSFGSGNRNSAPSQSPGVSRSSIDNLDGISNTNTNKDNRSIRSESEIVDGAEKFPTPYDLPNPFK